MLSGRYLDRTKLGQGDRLFDEQRIDKELTPPVLDKLKKLAHLAGKSGLTVPQLVLAYMLQIPGMGPVIAACSSPKQVRENAQAGKIILGEEQVRAVEHIIQKTYF